MRKNVRVAGAQSKTAKEYAEENLEGRLLDHTFGCADMARKLAKRFGADPEKAANAAYLHDLAKVFSHNEQAAMARKMGMSDAELRSHPPRVLHGPLGALIAEKELGIDDTDMLQAIKAHSTGCAGMRDVAKAVFVADYIEPTRRFPGSAELRERRFETLDEAVLAILERKLAYLIDRKMVIALRALECWNELVVKKD